MAVGYGEDVFFQPTQVWVVAPVPRTERTSPSYVKFKGVGEHLEGGGVRAAHVVV